MGNRFLDQLRHRAHDLMVSNRGDSVAAIAKIRKTATMINDLAGRPLCPPEELEKRRVRAMQPIPHPPGIDRPTVKKEAAPPAAPKTSTDVPVMLFFDGKDHRTKKKMEEVLQGRNIAFKVLDVEGDEASRSFALTASPVKEFPLVFIGGEAVGGFDELVQLDVSGELVKRVFGRAG